MLTTNFKNLIMDTIFHGNTSVGSIPSAYYLGLSTTTPSVNGSGVTEPSSSAGYARVLVSSLSASSNGTVSNSSIIEFNKSTGSWGTVTHAVLFDGDGNVCWSSPLSSSQTVSADNTLIFSVGELQFTLTDSST